MKDVKGSLLTIVLTSALILFYYSYVIINAGMLDFGAGGDGYKNYYTLAYYLKYDSGTHFSGMNYPYGEHIMFTDNQPVIAWILKAVVSVFPSVSNQIHGFLVYAIFISLIIAAFFIFKSLREMEVNEWLAAIFAVLIALLSPQLQRLVGHYSLGYSCFLPIVILLLIRFFKSSGSFKYFAWLTITLLFFSFIHPYYLAIAGMFILLIIVVRFLGDLKWSMNNLRLELLLTSSVIIPFSTLKIFLLITDQITDRPSAPWGFFSCKSTIADIFLHKDSFTGQTIDYIFPNASIVYHIEGYGYVGLIAVIALVGSFYFIIKKRGVNEGYLKSFFPFNYFLPASFIVLLFAMAFPFSIGPWEKYYDYMPEIVKQFRASGRFNWIFYYTATLFTTVLLSRAYEKFALKKHVAALLFIVIPLFIWFLELNMISKSTLQSFKMESKVIDEMGESQVFTDAFHASGKLLNDFQALLPLPIFVNGSEKLYLESHDAYEAMKISLYSGLPLASGQMSRTSEKQSFKLANLLSDPLMRKEIINDFKNDKPLLMFLTDDKHSDAELNLINQSKYLFNIENKKFYELPLSAFNDIQDSVKKYFADNKSILFKHNDYMSTDSNSNVVINRFENEFNELTPFGRGAYRNELEDAVFYKGELPKSKDSTAYEISIWLYSDSRRPAFPVIYATQSDYNGVVIDKYEMNPKFSTNTFGKWVRAQIDFTLYDHRNKLSVTAIGNYGTYDELLVRPKYVNVISDFKSDSIFIFNNFPIR